MENVAEDEEAPVANENATRETKPDEKKFLEGGWGWCVVLGSALSHFFIVGTPRSFGIFYEELLVRYQRSASETAWVIALSNTIRMVFGRYKFILFDETFQVWPWRLFNMTALPLHHNVYRTEKISWCTKQNKYTKLNNLYNVCEYVDRKARLPC